MSKTPEESLFTFSAEQRIQIFKAMESFIGSYAFDDPESPLRTYYGESYSLGVIQAARLIGKERPILDIIKNREIYNELVNNGFSLVKNNITRRISDQIIPEMQAHALSGSNPLNVAARLNKLFGDQNDNWRRLARTEMCISAETAKLKEWAAWDVRRVEYLPAPDACHICLALKGDYDLEECPIPGKDTHPHCRCSTRPASSEANREHNPQKPQVAPFVPAKTIQEANQWALDNDLADMVSYKGASVPVANAWNQSVFEHLQKFPELRANFKFIGTTQERQRKYVELRVAELITRYPSYSVDSLTAIARKEAGKTPGNVWAYANYDLLTRGVSVNNKFANNLSLFQDGLNRSVDAQFHPVGCNTVKSVIDHEIAHQLDKLLGIQNNPEYQAIVSGVDLLSSLSRYAAKNNAETIAEAWAEYKNNPVPRELSKKIGQLIENEYNKKHGGVS